MSDEIGLTEGWRYSVAVKDTASEGIFRGYALIGTGSAIVLQLADGKTRMIPTANISYIDLIGTAERKEDKKKESVYYG